MNSTKKWPINSSKNKLNSKWFLFLILIQMHTKFLKSLGILLVFHESNAPSSLEAHNALLL